MGKYFSSGKINLYYEEGWFVLEDGLGRCSVISEQKARDVELEPVLSAARQDVDRGGRPWEIAYRGIEIVEENGTSRYRLPSYKADEMIRTAPPVEIKGRFEIPARIGDHMIDMVWHEAFMGCAELEEVVLPEAVTFIGDKAFAKCSALRSINIPRGLTRVGMDPFLETKLETDRDPFGPAFIMDHVLIKVDPSLRGEYVVPEQITVIADYGFEHCRSLTRIVIPEQVDYIGNGAFYDCKSLSQIVLPKKVKAFSPYFSNCDNLEEVVLPEGVTTIGPAAFYGCEKLKKITIPESVQNVQSWAFGGRLTAKIEYAGKNRETRKQLSQISGKTEERKMRSKLHPVVRAVIMFVVGAALTLAVLWLVSLIKQTEFTIDWLNIVEGGAVVAVLDFIFPAAKRKQNREELKDKFKKK